MVIHPDDEKAFQQIDAAVFSGDAPDHNDFRERLSYFLKRWQQKLDDTSPDRQRIEKLAEQYESGELQI